MEFSILLKTHPPTHFSKNKHSGKRLFFLLKKSKILRKISRSVRFRIHLNFRIILSVIWKNRLLLNEYLGNFRHFQSTFFIKNDFFNTTHLPKVWKIPYFFFNPSWRGNCQDFKKSQILCWKNLSIRLSLIILA